MAVSTQAIRSVIAAEAGLDLAAVKPEMTLEELDISSLDLASALFALEGQFGIEVEPESIDRSATISDFVDYLLSQSGK